MTFPKLKEQTQNRVRAVSGAHRDVANFYNLLNVINIYLLLLFLVVVGLLVSCCATILVHALY